MFGTTTLQKGTKSPDVEELQIRLSGFSGGAWDGGFGDGTAKQVSQFQTDYMKVAPTGIADASVFTALDKFAKQFPFNFKDLECKCGKCGGFGKGINKGVYIPGEPKIEKTHQYEYPGIHRAVLWTVRALRFYLPQYRMTINCGYRCSIDNKNNKRTSTNHMGKAIDNDTVIIKGEKETDAQKCDMIRSIGVSKSNIQIGWAIPGKKSFEPSNISPTWVHVDVREMGAKYLEDRFFCKDLASLNAG